MSFVSYVTLITVLKFLHCSVCKILRVANRIFCISENFVIHVLLQQFLSGKSLAPTWSI